MTRAEVVTGNLVLKTRVALVIRNLELVQQALVGVEEHRAKFQQFLYLSARMAADLKQLKKQIERAKLEVDGEVADQLKDVVESMTGLEQGVTHLGELADSLHPPVTADHAEQTARAVHDSLRRTMSDVFGDDLKQLKLLQRQVNDFPEADPGERTQLHEVWGQYAGELYPNCQRIFEEYVDLVSGVALRDTGFDRGIAQLAEDLLQDGRTIGSYTWNALAIPSREEQLTVTAAGIVRLGFPEWTIWTLPLVAYELGSNFIDSDMQVDKRLRSHGGELEELRILTADAFATYLLGPAYACAAILMRLDPVEASAENGRVNMRVAIIIKVLRRISQQDPVSDLLGPIADRLVREWDAAVLQTGRGGSPAGASQDFEGGELPGGLSEADNQSLEDLLDAFVTTINAWISNDLGTWPDVELLAAQVKSGQEVNRNLLPELGLHRFLVNAAWRARIATQPGETDIEDPAELARIAAFVEEQMRGVGRDTPSPGDGSSGPPGEGASGGSGLASYGRSASARSAGRMGGTPDARTSG